MIAKISVIKTKYVGEQICKKMLQTCQENTISILVKTSREGPGSVSTQQCLNSADEIKQVDRPSVGFR